VFGNGEPLRHLAFFEETAAFEEHQPAWRAASAGLVALRLVDAWIDEGPEVVAPDSWNVRAVLGAIDAMDDGSTLPSILRSVVNAMQEATANNVHDVIPRLAAYGRALEYEAKWKLALDVYDTIVAHTHPLEESDAAAAAHIRRGVCLRTLGRVDAAQEAYQTAGRIAATAGDMIGVLQARLGDARIAVARGNLPQAERVLDDTIARASTLGISEVHSMALQDRAMVAGMRGRHDLAIELAYDALRQTASQIERDRILNDIGTAFHMLGLRSVARDAFLVLSATAQEQYIRWVATLSLMGIAAEDGLEPVFDQLRRQLHPAEMPPELEIEYYIRLGRGSRQLGMDDQGQIALGRAVELSEHRGLYALLFEAEEALRVPMGHRRTRSSEDDVIPPRVAGVAEAVRHMRMAAVAT
jgi:tetratricopeptide (TPR) repeat protein